MSFIDTNVSPTLEGSPSDPVVEPHTHYVQSDQVPAKVYTASTIPFSQDDVTKLAARIQRQGNFFFGRECRTPESAKYLARDLLYILDIMQYRLTDTYDPHSTGVVAGSPGQFLPEGSEIPFAMEDCQVVPSPDTAWLAGQYVDLGDGSQCTWLGFDSPGNHWNRRWTKMAPQPGMCYPAEPTITGQDQANADKIDGLGYSHPVVAWAGWDYITIGMFQFTWDGTKWLPAVPQ